MNYFVNLSGGYQRSRHTIFALGAAGVIALAIGCGGSGGGNGGGGGGGNNDYIGGDNVDVAVGVVASKSAAAGAALPFAVLNMVNPARGPRAFVRPATGLTLVPAFNLYESSTISGSNITLKFFTDAQGKTAAGTVTVAASEPVGSTYTYPVSFHATGTITGGTMPLTADFTANFTDAKGANTLKGSMTLSNDNITLTFNLSLNDTGVVGSSGTITSAYNYLYQGTKIPVTTTMSSLTGGPLTTINGAAAISATVPYLGAQTGTGTAVLDLVNGKFTLNVTGGTLQGLITAFNGGSDSMTVTAGDGFHTTVSDLTGFNLGSLLKTTGTGGTTGSTSGNGGKGYQTPVAIKGGKVTIEQALADGEMVGYALDSSNKSTGYYWTTPSGTPSALVGPNNATQTAAHGIAVYGGETVIVGSYANAGVNEPCFWIAQGTSGAFNVTAPDTKLPYGGVFQGISANGNLIVGYSYTSGSVEQPIAFKGGTVYPLQGDGRANNLRAYAVDNNNDILGAGEGSSPVPGVWKAASVDSHSNAIKTTFTLLPEISGISGMSALQAIHISPNGVIVGGDGYNGIYWKSSDGFVAHVLPIGSNAGSTGYGVNDAGTGGTGLLYAASPATTSDLAVWTSLTAAPVDVTAELGTNTGGFLNMGGFFLLSDGSVIAIGQTSSSSQTVEFVYIQNKS